MVKKRSKQVLIDSTTTGGTTYIGTAYSGYAQDDPNWALRQIIDGAVISIKNAEGIEDEVFKYSERATLEYK